MTADVRRRFTGAGRPGLLAFVVSSVVTFRPDAILLDFGGVVFATTKRPDGPGDIATHLCGLLHRVGREPNPERVLRSVTSGLTALTWWKHAQSRRREPAELTHRELVEDFLASELDDRDRAVLTGEAGEIMAMTTATLAEHTVRPGIRELLDLASRQGVPVGIVSNSHSGRSHRTMLAQHELAARFAVQVYSDELGLRKPHPGIFDHACRALGVDPGRVWYVGDTLDRDVVGARRAGVGRVLLTRAKHTDSPPFPVAERPDATYDDPTGVWAELRESLGRPGPAAPSTHRRAAAGAGPAPWRRGRALLVDHGGVISTSVTDEAAREAFADSLVELLGRSGLGFSGEQVGTAIEEMLSRRKADKRRQLESVGAAVAPEHREVTPRDFWAGLLADQLLRTTGAAQRARVEDRLRGVLAAEAADLMHAWYLAKSHLTLRPGARELLECCAADRVPVVMVSNTVNGRGVRDRLRDHGVAHLVGAHAFSDEVGWRKPDARIFAAALAMVDVPAADCVFLGDKVVADAAGARRAGIGHRALVRGGSSADPELLESVAVGDTHLVVDRPDQVVPLLTREGAIA